jgi:hypothetical protein
MRGIIICSFFIRIIFYGRLLHCCYLTTLRRTLQGSVQYMNDSTLLGLSKLTVEGSDGVKFFSLYLRALRKKYE